MDKDDTDVRDTASDDRRARRRVSWALLVLIGVAILVRAVVGFRYPPDPTPWSDEAQYINLGASLADGRGYVLMEGNFWPGQPTIIRAPGWPLMLAAAFAMVPADWRWETARSLSVILDGANVALIYLLARGLSAAPLASLMAAGLYALSPIMAAMSAGCASEVAGVGFILLFLNGMARMRESTVVRLAVVGLALGCAALIRPNFVIAAGLLVPGILWHGRERLLRAACLSLAFLVASVLPLTPWLVRNTIVFGHFPVIGAGAGEVMRGGNNDLTAEPGGLYEGYIVQPGQFPGERSLSDLARTMNEYEVDRYWFAQGIQWVRSHPAKLPMLALMKVKRAFVPVSRSRRIDVLVGNTYRGVIDVLALVGMFMALRSGRLPPFWGALAVSSVIVAHLTVAVLFCGVSRYVLPAEILFVFPAGYALKRGWRCAFGAVNGSFCRHNKAGESASCCS